MVKMVKSGKKNGQNCPKWFQMVQMVKNSQNGLKW